MSKQSKIYFDYYKLYTKTNIYYKLIKIYQKKQKKLLIGLKTIGLEMVGFDMIGLEMIAGLR